MREPAAGIFRNEQEYYKELLDVIRMRLDLYCRMTVSVNEDGELEQIRGHLLFRKELRTICEAPFSGEEVEEYRIHQEWISRQEQRLRQKGYATMAQGEMISLEYLCRIFQLESLDYYLLTMALAAELDGQFEQIFRLLLDDYKPKLPTIDLCIRMLTLDEVERLSLQQRIMERLPVLEFLFHGISEMKESIDDKRSWLSEPLKLDERILLFLQDITGTDRELSRFTDVLLWQEVPEKLPIREEYAMRLAVLVKKASKKSFLFLSGNKGIGKCTLASQIGRKTSRSVLLIHTKKLMAESELEEKIKRLIRESYLRGHAWLCFLDVECPEEEDEENKTMEKLLWALREYRGIPIFTSEKAWNHAWDVTDWSCMEFRVPDVDAREREEFWRLFLTEKEWPEELTPERLADKYMLTPGGIKRSVEDARQRLILEGMEQMTSGLLYSSCQRQMVHKLGKDALRVNSPYTWKDLILPDIQKRFLRDACDQVEYQRKVYREWGFSKKVAYGRGVSMIFYGPPGTGKTMGAQVMANELGLELYKINMASIMSRYVGESEKKLDVVFEQGRRSQSILFFDEADVLFGKRSETKDAQDRYANASTAYLLQKVEEYEGILILATNFLQNFDNAFCRRFKFIIEFPFPDIERRHTIWNHVFPEQMEMAEEIDTEWLAEEFQFSGSQIKNIALAASFLAAGEASGLTMKHVLTALKREQAKVGKQMIASDFGQYYYLME